MTSIRKNFIYQILYQVLTIILPLITSPYISRVMGAQNIGIYSYSYSIVTYFGLFILLGLNNYGNRTIASIKNDKEELSYAFWNIYAMQFLLGIFMILVYLLYVFFVSSNRMMAFIQVIYLISVTLDINWLFFGMEQFKITVMRNIIIKILTVLCMFLFVRTSDDIYIYAFLMTISLVATQLILWIYLKKNIVFIYPKLKEICKHIKPNIVLFIPVIAISLYTTMAKILLGSLSSTLEVGYFESANKLTSIPSLAITSLGTIMLPRVSNMLALGEETKSKEYLQKSLLISVFLSSSMAFGLSAISKEFVPLFYGTGYDKCILLIPILVLSSIFISWANVIRTQYLIPYKKDKIYIQSVFLGAIISLIMSILLIPKYNSIGAAISTLLAEIIVCVYQTFKVKKMLLINLYINQSLPFLLIGIIMYILVKEVSYTYNNFITIIIKIIVGIVIYMLSSSIYYKFKLQDELVHKK